MCRCVCGWFIGIEGHRKLGRRLHRRSSWLAVVPIPTLLVASPDLIVHHYDFLVTDCWHLASPSIFPQGRWHAVVCTALMWLTRRSQLIQQDHVIQLAVIQYCGSNTWSWALCPMYTAVTPTRSLMTCQHSLKWPPIINLKLSMVEYVCIIILILFLLYVY